MDDTALEIENISNCEDDLETDEPLVELIAAASLDHNNAEIMPIQETRAQPSQSQQTSVVPDDHMPVSTATQRSTSASSTTDVSPNSPRGTMTEPAGNDGNRTTISARIQPRIQQSHTELEENTARNGGAQNTQEDHIQRQDRLIEEPPPLYSNLFSPSYVHNATNNCDSRRISLQANCCNEHHNRLPPSTVPRHSLCQDPSCLQHWYPPPFPHSSQHHTILPLPGEIGQHPAHYHTQMAPHHTTVLPMHHRGSEPDQVGAEDYLKLSFICLILCSFHLNLPALLCVLPALAYSIKAQNLNVERRYRQARKYSRAALTCNLIASCQYIIVVLVFVVIALQVLYT